MNKIACLLLMILLLSTAASALRVFNTKELGENPDLYFTTIAFETKESGLKEDLNNDGDTTDTIIRYYDTETKEAVSTGIAGKNPKIFGYYIAFESPEQEQDQDLNGDDDKQDTIIILYNIKDKKIISTTAAGHAPSIYGSSTIAFHTPEQAAGIDYNNDGDQTDNIIRYYKIKEKEVVNTKQAGINAAITGKYILFETSEAELGEDLNKDQDKNDHVLRFYALETGKTANTMEQGSRPEINKNSLASVTLNGEIAYYDAAGQKMHRLNITGSSPSISEKHIAFSQDNKIYTYTLESSRLAKTELEGIEPVISDDKIAFVVQEQLAEDLNEDGDKADSIICYAIDEDLDNDSYPDFADNCPGIANDQKDLDNDGIGSACDNDEKTVDAKKETAKANQTEERKPLPASEQGQTAAQQEPEQAKGKGFFTWMLIILAIIAGSGLVIYAWIMHKKKVKGFGF